LAAARLINAIDRNEAQSAAVKFFARALSSFLAIRAAGDGVMGLRLLDRTKVAVYRIYCADRERDPEQDGNRCRNDKFYGDHFVSHRGSSL